MASFGYKDGAESGDNFPVIATICHDTDSAGAGEGDNVNLPDGVDIMIYGKKELEFGHIEICDYTDPEAMQARKGAEFVLDHDGFVGDHYIVPIGITTPLRVVNQPGRRKTYTTVSQIIEDMPRYVRVSEAGVALDLGGTFQLLEANSVHEIIEVKQKLASKWTDRIVTKDIKGQTYIIGAKGSKIRCIPIPDTKEYTLKEIVTNAVIRLPRKVEFQPVSPYDIVSREDRKAEELHVMWSGPINIIGTEKRQFLIGRMKLAESFVTLLIPVTAWKRVKSYLKFIEFKTYSAQLLFAKVKFPARKPTDFTYMEKMLYAIEYSSEEIFQLRDHSTDETVALRPRKQTVTAKTKRGGPSVGPGCQGAYAVPAPRSVTSVKHSPEHTPPVPARIPIVPGTDVALPTRKLTKKDVDTMVKTKQKMGFGRIHVEIRNIFSSKGNKSDKVKTPPTHKRHGLSHDTTVLTKSGKQKNIDELSPLENSNKYRTLPSNTTVQTKSGKQKSIELPALENRYKNRTLPSTPSPRYGKLPSASARRAAAVPRQTSANSAKEHTEYNKAACGRAHVLAKVDEDSNTYVDMTSVSTPTGVSQGDTVSPDPCYEMPVFTRTNITEQSPLHEIGSGAVNRVSVLGQTGADFYKYSVNEVVHCFTLCALPDLAEICKSEKLDGMFFRRITDECLLEAPFSLSRLQLKKMYMAIKEGWRPH